MAISEASAVLVPVTTDDKNCISNVLNITKIEGAGKVGKYGTFKYPFFSFPPIQDCFRVQDCALIRRKRYGCCKGLCGLST